MLLLSYRLIEIWSWRWQLLFNVNRLWLKFLRRWRSLLLLSFIGRWWGWTWLRGSFFLGRSCLDELGVIVLTLISSIISLGIVPYMFCSSFIYLLELSSRCLLRCGTISDWSITPGLTSSIRRSGNWFPGIASVLWLIFAFLGARCLFLPLGGLPLDWWWFLTICLLFWDLRGSGWCLISSLDWRDWGCFWIFISWCFSGFFSFLRLCHS